MLGERSLNHSGISGSNPDVGEGAAAGRLRRYQRPFTELSRLPPLGQQDPDARHRSVGHSVRSNSESPSRSSSSACSKPRRPRRWRRAAAPRSRLPASNSTPVTPRHQARTSNDAVADPAARVFPARELEHDEQVRRVIGLGAYTSAPRIRARPTSERTITNAKTEQNSASWSARRARGTCPVKMSSGCTQPLGPRARSKAPRTNRPRSHRDQTLSARGRPNEQRIEVDDGRKLLPFGPLQRARLGRRCRRGVKGGTCRASRAPPRARRSWPARRG